MTIRILHHWACSGGTLLSRMVASLPRVVLLSEVHPLAHLRLGVPSAEYLPTDLIQQLCLPHNGSDPVLCAAAWNGAIDALQAALQSENRQLVLRSHSHIDFFTGGSCADEAFVSRSLAPRHRLLELVSVRHPLDSWISIQAQGWDRHFNHPSLNEFCRRGLLMLQAFSCVPLLRYEDLCTQPQAAMEQICSVLELPSAGDSAFDSLPKELNLSGNSGRGGNQIEPRPRRPIPSTVEQELIKELEQQKNTSSYWQLCEKLGYDPDPAANHPFTMDPWSSQKAVLVQL